MSRVRAYLVLWRDRKHKKFFLDYFWTSKDPKTFKGSFATFRQSFARRPNDWKMRVIKSSPNRQELFLEYKRFVAMIKNPDRYYNDSLYVQNDRYTAQSVARSKAQLKRWTIIKAALANANSS